MLSLTDKSSMIKKLILIGFVLVCFLGLYLRFMDINKSDFIYYDEGYYLNHNRIFVDIIENYSIQNFEEFRKAFYALVRFSLATGKALWFFIVDFRVFVGGATVWYFPRIISAIAGALTLWMIYFFAKRFYSSKEVARLSVAILAILPGHVFYSRLAMQEAFSTLFFLMGFYFYIFPRKFGWRTFLSTLCFVCVFFTNYRLIILPILVGFCELYLSFALKEKFNFRKLMWNTLTFVFLIFMIGNIDEAQNTIITFSWMFHQAELAQESTFDVINFLSYPYYLFRLESLFLGLAFFGNIYFLIRKKWQQAFPFMLVCVLMGGFSLAEEKGARYLCVGLPFVVMAVSSLMVFLYQERHSLIQRRVTIGFTTLLLISFFPKTEDIVTVKSDYQTSMRDLMEEDPNIKIMSSQNYVHNLYVPDKHNIEELPHGFPRFVELHSKGYRYLVVGPQAYISYTKSGNRFDPKLKDYLGFVVDHVEPKKTYSHFNDTVLERFVFEHNENLNRSIEFLSQEDKDFGALRVYDVKKCIAVVLGRLSRSTRSK